jgi:uncharacterized repeat protein (TIGR01451 family)
MRSLTSTPRGNSLPKLARLTILVFLILFATLLQNYPQSARAQSHNPRANIVAWQTLQPAQHVPTIYKGRSDTVAKLQSGAAKPLAMASADLDGDGIADLVIGFAHSGGGILAFHRGNLDAFAPQSHASWLAIAHEQFPPAFLSQATVVDVPEAPQFIVTGDFSGNGNVDVLTGARGSNHLYLLMGIGKGNFSKPQQINLPGNLTALAAGQVGVRDGKADVVVGIESANAAAVLVYKGSAGGLSTGAAVSYAIPQAATQLEIADLHGDGFADVAVLADSEVLIVHPTASAGADTTSLVERVPVSSAKSIAVGSFVLDRNSSNQLAVLSPGGIVQVLSPHELDTRPFTAEERFKARWRATHKQTLSGTDAPIAKAPWSGEAEAWNMVKSASVSAPMSGNVRLMAASLAHARPQDLVVVDSSDSRLHVLPANTSGDLADEAGELTVETGDALVAMLAVRVNNDARPGLVMVGKSVSHPKTMAPRPDPTFTVNRFDDPAASTNPVTVATYCLGVANDCSLREAVIKANLDSLSDTISIPTGTITLTQIGLKENDGVTGDIDVRATVSIVGSVDGNGNPTSIVQGCGGTSGITCSSGTAWNDKFISTNKDGTTDGSLSISNVIFRNGNNTNSDTPADPFFNFLGGAVDFFGCAPEGGGCNNGVINLAVASLTITNVRFLNNSANGCTGNACGGGLDSEFGPTTIATSLFSGNSAVGLGGGLMLEGAQENNIITATNFNNSSGNPNHSDSDGGAIFAELANNLAGATAPATGTLTIHSSTFENNTATSQGAGIYIRFAAAITPNQATATIDQGTVISGNSASDAGGGITFQGLTLVAGSTAQTSLTMSKVTITGNHANNSGGVGGGGILLNSGGTLNLQYGRIVNNTTAASGKPTGLSIESGVAASASVVNAADNWWGCNTGPTASPCDTAAIEGGTGATLTDSPWIVLTLTANPTSVQAVAPNNTSSLTADFLHDSAGGAVSANSIDVLLNLPITFGATAGSISGAQANIQGGNVTIGTATATFTHDANCNTSSATATVDTSPPPTVTTPITILCPDLTAGKSNSLGLSGATTPLSSPTWTWTTDVLNSGVATAPATFTSGQTIFTDTLPSGNVSYSNLSFNPVTNMSCSVVANLLTCSASGGGVTLGVSQGFFVGVTATATAAGSYINPTGGSCAVDPNNDVPEFNESNNSCSNTVIVVAPPAISKAFGATSIGVGGTTTLTFTLTNPSANTVAETGVAFSDTLSGGLQVAATPNLVNHCGGTFTGAASSSTSLSLSAGSIPVNSSCTISLNVTGTTAGTVSNTTGAVSSTNGGTGTTSNTATITVANPPTISKSFTPASISVGGISVLGFSITNPNSSLGLTGVAFSDTLPTGVVVAGTPGVSTNCNGTFTATAGAGSVSLSGGTITSGSSCAISVNVTSMTTGVYSNTTGNVTANESGTAGSPSNTAMLTVLAPPTILKGFSPTTIPTGNDSTLTLTISNPNSASGLSGVSFSDVLPSGLQVVSSPNVSNTCNGTVTAAANSSTISLSGGMVIAGGSCAISVDVTSTLPGTYNNTTGAISSNEGGTGTTSNTATVIVIAPVCFAPPSGMIDWWPGEGNGNDITGGNTLTPQNGAGFATGEVGQAFNFVNPTFSGSGQYAQNTAPTGLPLGSSARTIDLWFNSGTDLSTSNDAALIEYGTQTSEEVFGLIFSANAPGKLSFYGSGDDLAGTTTIQPNTWYHAAVTYDGSTVRLYLNGALEASKATTSLNTVLDGNGLTLGFRPGVSAWNGQIDEGEMFNRALTAGDVQSIYLAGSAGKCKSNATISKSFAPTSIAVGGTSKLGFTITNSNAEVSLTGVSFTDTLPTGVQVASTPNVTNTCGGTFTAAAGTGTVSLSGGQVGTNNSCTLSVDVTSSTAGSFNNTTGPISTNEAGTGSASNTATLTVVAPPSMTKAFNPASITVNGVSALTFTITNPAANTVAEAGVAFTDTLPAGLVVATPNGLTNNCGGTATAVASSGSISLTGGSIAVSSNCTLAVNVTATTSGTKNNTSGNVSSTNGGTGNTASASLSVATPPTTSKAFGAATIPLNGSTSLTLTITNPNSTLALTGVSFTDNLPSGLQVASVPSASNGCGGTLTGATAGSTSFSLSGGSLAASAFCTVSLNVAGTTAGVKNNSTAASSNETGAGSAGTASITVVAPPTISKAFGATSIPLNGSTSVTLTITNPNTGTALSGVAFSDTLVAGLVVASPNGASNSCGGTLTATAGSSSISLSSGSIALNSSCTVSVNVTGTTAGSKSNTTGAVSSTNGGTGTASNTATLTVVAPPSISKAFSPTSVAVNGTSTLTLTITNPNTGTALSGVAVTDTLPSGLQVAATPGATNSCGGTFTAAANSTSISLTGGTISGSSCALTVNVTPTTSGNKVNTTGNVSSTNGGTGNTASATLGAGDFTISVTPTTETIPPGHMAVYTLTLASTTGFQGTINLACSTTGPPGSTCTITPSSVTLTSGSETAKVTVHLAVPRGASKGTFTLTFTATSGTLTHSTTAQLKVGK